MKLPRLTFETFLYVLIFAFALLLRLYNLGATPLSDVEAVWALQAKQVSNLTLESQDISIGPHPAYVFLTSSLFALFGASNFLARLWPALVGTWLILLPLLFRRELGRTVALIIALGLSLDPGLVTVSRQAGSPMMALGFGLLALGFWHLRDEHSKLSVIAGVSGGLALLSGPALFIGMPALVLAWFIERYVRKKDRSRNQDNSPSESSEQGAHESTSNLQEVQSRDTNAHTALLAGGVTILMVGTFFFRQPQGLTAWFQMLPAYLTGWISPSGVKPEQLIVALLVYQPLALILTLLGVFRWLVRQSLWEETEAYLLTLPLFWAIIGLLSTLLYPGREVSDLIWTLVPLWILAGSALEEYLPQSKPSVISSLQASLILVLSILFWNTLIASSQIITTTPLESIGLRFGILIGIISLGALTTILVSLGWSWKVSRNGLMWGLITAFTIYLISVMWGASQSRANQPQELWSRPPAIGQAELFVHTLQDLSTWKTGFTHQIDVVSMVDTPSLQWILRDYPNVRFEQRIIPGLHTNMLPSAIITYQEQEALNLPASYRGQDFVWWVRPDWTGSLPPDTSEWLTFRKAPLSNEKLILWARSDLFPGGILESNTNSLENP